MVVEMLELISEVSFSGSGTPPGLRMISVSSTGSQTSRVGRISWRRRFSSNLPSSAASPARAQPRRGRLGIDRGPLADDGFQRRVAFHGILSVGALDRLSGKLGQLRRGPGRIGCSSPSAPRAWPIPVRPGPERLRPAPAPRLGLLPLVFAHRVRTPHSVCSPPAACRPASAPWPSSSASARNAPPVRSRGNVLGSHTSAAPSDRRRCFPALRSSPARRSGLSPFALRLRPLLPPTASTRPQAARKDFRSPPLHHVLKRPPTPPIVGAICSITRSRAQRRRKGFAIAVRLVRQLLQPIQRRAAQLFNERPLLRKRPRRPRDTMPVSPAEARPGSRGPFSTALPPSPACGTDSFAAATPAITGNSPCAA